ncbi:heparinase II/III family protein [Halobacillus litoralis]|uniref:heparinase II/III family protein n=1 Tax=Halobacillus litoralis TaxID=45668 RepID=UPI001CD3276C|nr:heparinase II/III-family protein [Halobacillus litoralis]MCA1021048.1 heparinase II/III-family protein [Halobacillus litoralis]
MYKDKQRIDVLVSYKLPNSTKLEEICEDLLNNHFYKNAKQPTVHLEGENIWTADPYDRSWRFWLHCLVPVGYLLDGYERFNEPEYFNKALSLLLNWKQFNYPQSNADMAWHDHSTALRLNIICKFYETWRKEHWNADTQKELEELVEQHCDLLLEDDFYRFKHNHGMDQDISLVMASTVFSHLPKSDKWLKKGMERFWIQVHTIFGDDGSYLEHSPDYVYLLSERLLSFASFLKDNQLPEHDQLNNKVTRILEFFLYTLQPDGTIPQIGDSATKKPKFKDWKFPNQKIKKSLISLVEGKNEPIPYPTEGIFPIGEFVMMRNKWEFAKDTNQLIFLSGFHSRTHKHNDDLSFTLFGHGQPLLIDGGKYSYEYSHTNRKYVTSTKAHNTVTVDGINSLTNSQNIGKSGITSFCFNDQFSYSSAAHTLYPGVKHRRSVIYLKPHDFIVIDKLEGYKEHTFDQVFNFDETLKCEVNNNQIIGYKADEQLIKITPIIDKNVELFYGSEEPMQGWASYTYATLDPIYSAVYKDYGDKATFVTHITTKPDHSNIVCKFEDDRLVVRLEENELQLFLTQNYEHIFFNNEEYPTEKIEKPKLQEGLLELKQGEKFKEQYANSLKRRKKLEKELNELKNSLEEE